MSTRGDPLFDLATLLSYWAEPGDPDCLRSLGQMPTASPGFWTRRMAAERYAALTGRDISDLPAMRVLAMLKLGIVFLQLHRQWIGGAVTDPRYQRFRETGEELLLHTRNIAKGLAT
jgi:aminoglycoside phosphotransferase (APT) family kinase protein